MYSETSLQQPPSGDGNITTLERWPFKRGWLFDQIGKGCLIYIMLYLHYINTWTLESMPNLASL